MLVAVDPSSSNTYGEVGDCVFSSVLNHPALLPSSHFTRHYCPSHSYLSPHFLFSCAQQRLFLHPQIFEKEFLARSCLYFREEGLRLVAQRDAGGGRSLDQSGKNES